MASSLAMKIFEIILISLMRNMKQLHKAYLVIFIASMFWQSASYALGDTKDINFSGRLSTSLNSTYLEEDNTLGLNKNEFSFSGQESLRLMLDSFNSDAEGFGQENSSSEWSTHIKSYHQHTDNSQLNPLPSGESAFRYRQLREDWDSNDNTFIGYEIDRLYYKQQIDRFALSVGRQAIDWGSGRFWQPMNVFGAFSPIDLDTDYKTGIDSIYAQYFPTPFSSFSFAYVFSTQDKLSNNQKLDKHNVALRYRTQIADNSELALLYADILERSILAASFESDWQGLGWRIEAAHYDDQERDNLNQETSLWFWIAGIDYQFSNGSLLSFEWYQNDFGISDAQDIDASLIDVNSFNTRPAQQQLGKQALGVSLAHDISPLLNLQYTGLIGTLKNNQDRQYSILHQVNLQYSLSNNSDLLFSVLTAQGKEKKDQLDIQSDYGHIPSQATLRLRVYFGQT